MKPEYIEEKTIEESNNFYSRNIWEELPFMKSFIERHCDNKDNAEHICKKIQEHYNESIDWFITQTHNNALKVAVEEIIKYQEDIIKLQDEMMGTTHKDNKMMLSYDMHSRLIAIKHILERLKAIKNINSKKI